MTISTPNDLESFINQPGITITMKDNSWVATNAWNEILKKGYLNNINLLLQIKEGMAKSQAMEWHQRLGHLLLSRMKEYATMGIIKGFDTHSFDQTINSLQCTSCILSDLKAKKFPKGQANRATRASQWIHIDGKDPFKVKSRNGYKYVLVVVDDFTRKRWTRCVKKKSQYALAFFQIAKEIETHCGRPIECIRSDNEFRSYVFSEWCKRNGIRQEFTPHTPAQNEIAERSVGYSWKRPEHFLKNLVWFVTTTLGRCGVFLKLCFGY
jgi:hypothetical protein